MATVPTITNIAAGAKYSTTGLNQRFQTLANAFANVVGVDGANTTLTGDIDMNGQEVKNLGAPTTTNSAARLKDIQDASDSNINSAVVDLRTELGTNTAGFGSDMIAVVGSANNLTNYLAVDVLAGVQSQVDDGTFDNVTLTNTTLDTPTVTNLANMDHLHDTESNGGVLTGYAKWANYVHSNISSLTIGAGVTLLATTNIGSVVANSKYLVVAHLGGTSGASGDSVSFKMNTNASTNAAATFTSGANLLTTLECSASSTWKIPMMGFIHVSSGGTLILDFYGGAANITAATGTLDYDIVRIY